MVRKGSFSEMLGDREKPKSYHSCAVTAKEPRLLVKELQRMFGENKLLLRASGASFVKGDKNKTRFDIVIYKVSSRVGVLCRASTHSPPSFCFRLCYFCFLFDRVVV